jgi:murein DD-endopeptidase MepM/ murein hydrolase activator NlpD
MTEKARPWLIYLIAALSIVVIIVFSYLYYQRSKALYTIEVEEEEAEELVFDEFGFVSDQFSVHSESVRPNQTLSHILASFDMSPDVIHRIVDKMQDVFNPRRIRAGQTFHGYYTADSLSNLKYFVYEISPLEFLKIGFEDSLIVERGEKEVTIVPKTASGIIHSSLWNTLSASNLNPELAIRLSEVLAWEVDFYRIQKGDRFKVVYEESFVGEKSIGIPRIEAVFFVHQGREIHGFNFEADTISGFFNPEGENLRKVFLKAPLEFGGRISSRFSHSRLHPILKHRRPHYGTDYAAPHGTPILAVGDGVVTETAYTSGNGNYVRIRHNSVYETQYLHMSRFGAGIRPGTRVTQGQVIGYVGSTGLATGPHVCFRFWKNGQQVDHLREEFPSADPLHPDYHEAFSEIRDQLMEVLESIEFTEEIPV